MSYAALGYDLVVDTPIGKQTISIPLEQAASDAAKVAVAAAWPEVQKRVNQDLPGVVDKALDEAQPRVRSEADRAIDVASERASLIAAGLGVIVVLSALWVRHGLKQRRI
jgi:hypothetical protein